MTRRIITLVLAFSTIVLAIGLSSVAFATGTKYTVSVTKTGSGKITSDPRGVKCYTDSASCSGMFRSGTVVKLTAEANSDTAFGGWGGDCASQSGRVCKFRLTRNYNVSASFVQTHRLAVDVQGPGKVSSDPDGIKCGDECKNRFRDGTAVSLNANPDDHALLSEWTGACAGQATETACELSMTQDLDAGAVFAKATGTATATARVADRRKAHHRAKRQAARA